MRMRKILSIVKSYPVTKVMNETRYGRGKGRKLKISGHGGEAKQINKNK